MSEKQELTTAISDRRGDLERLRRDKEHLDQLADQRADELTELRIALDRYKVQLEEKEKLLSTFRQQSSNITQLMEVSCTLTHVHPLQYIFAQSNNLKIDLQNQILSSFQ